MARYFTYSTHLNDCQIDELLESRGGIETKEGWIIQEDCFLEDFGIYKLPKILEVHGDLALDYNKFENMENFPKYIEGNFYFNLMDRPLLSLKGFPKIIKKNLFCD